ncbi:hypothetical protein Tco_1180487 [Tanacetum coccineum]
MVDLQPERERVQGVEEKGIGTGSQEGPSAPALLAQTTPSPAFIIENIDVLRTLIKEHDQQNKPSATLKKLTYGESREEGLSERSSDGSYRTARTQSKAHSTWRSQMSFSCTKTSSHLTRSKRTRRVAYADLVQNFPPDPERSGEELRYATVPAEIHGIKRRSNEGLQAFMDWFKLEGSHIKGVLPVLRIFAFTVTQS